MFDSPFHGNDSTKNIVKYNSMAASSVRLSKDTFLFLLELANMEMDNRGDSLDEDEEELWEEAQEALQTLL